MATEPESLGDRLRALERDTAHLRGDVEHLKVAAASADAMLEHVLMPAILLLAGHGHHERLAGMVLRAEEEFASRQKLDDTLQEFAVEWFAGWRKWIENIPEWEVPTDYLRHPDLYP